MKDESKTERQLICELNELRQQIADVKCSEEEFKQLKENNEKFIKELMQGSIPMSLSAIKEDRYTEDALRESEEKYQLLFNNSLDAIAVFGDTPPKVLFVNPAFVRLFGYSAEEILAFSADDIFLLAHPEDREMVKSRLRNRFRQKNTLDQYAFRTVTKDGQVRWVEVSATLYSNGEQLFSQAIFRDITERKKMEDALRESEEKYREIFENTVEGIFQTTPKGRYIQVNPAFARILGYASPAEIKEAISDIGKQIYPDPSRRLEIKRLLAEHGMIRDFEVQHFRKDRKIIWVAINANAIKNEEGNILSYQGTIMDITEKKNLEAQLLDAQKMEAIGTLAGGIAHDFNNLLMGIQGHVSLILQDIDSSHPYYGHLKSVETQVESGADLTGKLLGFARKGKYAVKPRNINDIIQKISSIFGRTKKEISIYYEYGENIWAVEVDQVQMEQMFMNLFVNAWQAMPAGGNIHIKTENVLGDNKQTSPDPAREQKYVKISVTDTGTGMDESTKARIFDPFFTTRKMRRGTGLGLATVYGIIKGHNGYINVDSEPGHGTTFTIYLPASGKKVITEKIVEGSVPKGAETVLLVDDEQMILEVTRALLESLGYRVYIAQSGQEAIAVYMEKGKQIDLVILDMTMPGISGGETFNRLREINPEARVLLSSGYSINGEAQQILDRGCNGFLPKPFRLKELAQNIRKMLA